MVSARRLIVQEGGLYNGEFHMITDDSLPAATGSSHNSRKPAAERTNGEPAGDAASEDVVGSDQWWAKIAGKEIPADSEPPANDARRST
jgi:hypothetical protein